MKKSIAMLVLAAVPLTAAPAQAAETNVKQKIECMFYTYIQQGDPLDCWI